MHEEESTLMENKKINQDLPTTKKDIPKPLEFDVICGRGGAALRHTGNQTYRHLVNLNKYLYTTCLKAEKLKISRSIVAAIREQNGHFLEKDTKTGMWFDIGDKKALEKTSQALREGQPKLRQTIEGLKQTSTKNNDDNNNNNNYNNDKFIDENKKAKEVDKTSVSAVGLSNSTSIPSSSSSASSPPPIDFADNNNNNQPDLLEYPLPSLQTREICSSIEQQQQQRPALEKREFVPDLSPFVVSNGMEETNNNKNSVGEIHGPVIDLVQDNDKGLWDEFNQQLMTTTTTTTTTSRSQQHPPSLTITENDVISYMNDNKPSSSNAKSPSHKKQQQMDLRQIFAKLKVRRPPSSINMHISSSSSSSSYTTTTTATTPPPAAESFGIGSTSRMESGSDLMFAKTTTSSSSMGSFSFGQTALKSSNASLLTSSSSNRSLESNINADIWRSKEFRESVPEGGGEEEQEGSCSTATATTTAAAIALVKKRSSLLSNFSRVPSSLGGVSRMSLVSNLSEKIGDIGSVRSIAMSDFSALEEEDNDHEEGIAREQRWKHWKKHDDDEDKDNEVDKMLWRLDTIVGSKAEMEMSHQIKM